MEAVRRHDWIPNDAMLRNIEHFRTFAVEVTEGKGLPMGSELRNTVWWGGRFYQKAETEGMLIVEVRRSQILKRWHIQGSDTDKWLKEALLEEFMYLFPGWKRNKTGALTVPGWDSHQLTALACAVIAGNLE